MGRLNFVWVVLCVVPMIKAKKVHCGRDMYYDFNVTQSCKPCAVLCINNPFRSLIEQSVCTTNEICLQWLRATCDHLDANFCLQENNLNTNCTIFTQDDKHVLISVCKLLMHVKIQHKTTITIILVAITVVLITLIVGTIIAAFYRKFRTQPTEPKGKRLFMLSDQLSIHSTRNQTQIPFDTRLITKHKRNVSYSSMTSDVTGERYALLNGIDKNDKHDISKTNFRLEISPDCAASHLVSINPVSAKSSINLYDKENAFESEPVKPVSTCLKETVCNDPIKGNPKTVSVLDHKIIKTSSQDSSKDVTIPKRLYCSSSTLDSANYSFQTLTESLQANDRYESRGHFSGYNPQELSQMAPFYDTENSSVPLIASREDTDKMTERKMIENKSNSSTHRNNTNSTASSDEMYDFRSTHERTSSGRVQPIDSGAYISIASHKD